MSKTTVLEALDLTLGPDRGRGPDVVGEHDFFAGSYCDVVLTSVEAGEASEGEAADASFPEIKIIATLGYLGDEDRIRFRGHLEPWSLEEGRLLAVDEVEGVRLGPHDFVLRIGFRAWYDPEEDDFETRRSLSTRMRHLVVQN